MGNLSFLTRAEIESLGPPTPEELEETEVSEAFLRDLSLKHVAALADPTTANVAERIHLPLALTDELLYQLYREKVIEIRLQSAVGLTRYAMLDLGWERVARLHVMCGYTGPAPVTSTPTRPAVLRCRAGRWPAVPGPHRGAARPRAPGAPAGKNVSWSS